jgi:hypothetical protein
MYQGKWEILRIFQEFNAYPSNFFGVIGALAVSGKSEAGFSLYCDCEDEMLAYDGTNPVPADVLLLEALLPQPQQIPH